MSKLVVLRGLPASGKSTRAQEILKESGNAVRLNKDLIREMLHFSLWTPRNEEATHASELVLAEHFITHGRKLVVDDTNLNPKVMEGWKQFAKSMGLQYEVIDMDTSLEECLRRDRIREKRVGDHVIVGMAMQYGLYETPKNGIVICDLDGTLCDISHRRHFVDRSTGKKNWPAFFAAIGRDAVRNDVLLRLIDHWNAGREVFFVSGRPDTYRKVTEEWLEKNTIRLPYRALFMRRAGDHRDDTIVKREIYDRYFKHLDVVEVIDDRPSVIRMWRSLGLHVVDVGTGEEF